MNVTFQVTPYHTAIATACETKQCVVVNAGPGSGKTTTIKMVIVPILAKLHGKGGAIAFNTSNAYELGKALAAYTNVACSGEHSALYKCLKKALPAIKVQVEGKAGKNKFGKWMPATVSKCELLASVLFTGEDAPDLSTIKRACSLVSKMKLAGMGLPNFPAIDDREAIDELIASHAMDANAPQLSEDSDSMAETVSVAIKLMHASNLATGACDFDDMIYMTLLLNAPLPDWDFLVYDEGQDMKPVTLEFFRRMHARGCQIVIVGDVHQAINFFAGSMHMALETGIETLNAISCPLPVSYRCSKIAAELACEVFPNAVIAASSANQGEHLEMDMPSVLESVDYFDNNYGVLSRTHKNIMPIALKFLATKKAFVYKGIAELVARMERMLWHAAASKDVTDIETVRKNLTEYQATLEDTKKRANGTLPAWVVTNGETTDALCLLLAYVQGNGEGLPSVKGYLKQLQDASFSKVGPTLSTLHSSKGMEWSNVYLLGELVSPLATTEQQLHAEKCLKFVALTRSSDKIVSVSL